MSILDFFFFLKKEDNKSVSNNLLPMAQIQIFFFFQIQIFKANS